MTADTALDAPTGPLPFFALAPDLEVRKADPEALGTYWLAFAQAHYKALDGALSGSQAKRDAHLFAYMAGFTIAALTHGWAPDRIAAAFEDGASAAEFTWQWLNEAGVDADRVEPITALYERMDKREAERGERVPLQVPGQTAIEDHLTD